MARSQEIINRLKHDLAVGVIVLVLGCVGNLIGHTFDISILKFSRETMKDGGDLMVFLLGAYFLVKCTEAIVAAIKEGQSNEL